MKNILNKVSLTRLTGIKNIICVDIHPGFIKFTGIKRKESPFLIKKKSFFDYEIIFTEQQVRLTESDIKKTIVDLCGKYKITNTAVIAGINEYRSTLISIPAETEDDELWFDENKQKFLPENLNPDDFVYTYEKVKEDENIKQYLLVIARNDLIENVINNSKAAGLKLLGVVPLPFAVLSDFLKHEQNMLYIDLCGNNIFYTSRTESGNILYNNFFFELYTGKEEKNFNSNLLNTENLKFCLEEIKQSLLLAGNNNVQNLSVYVSYPSIHSEQISNAVKHVFAVPELNSGFHNIDPYFISSIYAANNIINDIDYGLNLYKNSLYLVERSKIEKDLTLRISLAAGCTILVILLFIYLAESFLHEKFDSGEEAFAEVKARSQRIERLKLENTRLKFNLNSLIELKYNKPEESVVLSEISKIINASTFLTEIRVQNEKDMCQIELSGIAHSQQDVAEFITNLEKTKTFSGISLLYSSRNEDERNRLEAGLSGKVRFKIKSDYNADKN